MDQMTATNTTNTKRTFNRLRSPGPYIGTVVNNLDPSAMGRLEVWIPELVKKPINAPRSSVIVNYAPPFYGSTNLAPNSSPSSAKTTQSYGMWFVPPDIGVRVLVTFVNRDLNQGYWFACIPSQLMNHMIPGIAHRGAASENAPDREPITEYDKSAAGEFATDFATDDEVYNNLKITPPHLYQATVLEKQGLNSDEARGPSASTARRESPSYAFGISTPGQPTARISEDPSQDFKSYQTVTGRTGGHQFVMDDGNALGESQLLKLRSSNGGTIMINDTIGSIYVINQNGSAWVELTANGRIDVYGRGSVSVHSENDINFTADNNINLLATKNINMVANENINTEAVDQRHYGKSKMYFRSPDAIIESDSLTLIARKGVGSSDGAASEFGSGFTLQADNGIMQFRDSVKTAAGKEITFETETSLQVNAAGVITLKTGGQIELDAAGGILEAVKAGTGTIAKFTQAVDTEMLANDSNGDSKNPTGWTDAKNWFEGPSTEIVAVDEAFRTSSVIGIPKAFSSGIQQSHIEITPQREPWAAHDVGVSSSSIPGPSGAGMGDPMFVNGSGMAFPEDTTNIVSGAVDYALNDALANFLSEININFNAFKEDYAATVSRGRYTVMPDASDMINSNGFIGRYQLSMADLKLSGTTVTDSQGAVRDDASWTPVTSEISLLSAPQTPEFGPGSAAAFLRKKDLQEKCFVVAVYATFKSLKKLGIITGTETPAERAGWLKVARLMGVGSNLGKFTQFAPSMKLEIADVQQLTSSQDGTGNGAIGLYVHRQVLRSPGEHSSRDPSGNSSYKYYAQGSRTQS